MENFIEFPKEAIMATNIHVEILLNYESKLKKENIILEVSKFLSQQEELPINSILSGLPLPIRSNVKEIKISLDNNSAENTINRKIDFKSCNPKYYVYRLEPSNPNIEEMLNGDEDIASATNWSVPNEEFHELWDMLIYEQNIKDNLLNFVNTALLFSDSNVNKQSISWNNVVLLHGPPGTGKTSLCKALAHKVAIRMSDRYNYCQLIEVNSHSLFSKWFSESGKLVQKLFTEITEILENKDSLVIVLIDEVESLSRDRSNISSNEPSDGVRVVNALLTQIDQLKRYSNVLILTTSNISGTIDLAFVDRADIKEYIGSPTENAIYSIYVSCLNELTRRKIIYPEEHIFSLDHLHIMKNQENDVTRPSLKLYEASQNSVGLSGRTLRKIPFLAHAMFVQKSQCNLLEFIEAMKKAIAKQFSDVKKIHN